MVGGDVDEVATPTEDIGAEIAIFGAKNVKGAFRMLIVWERGGITAPLDGNGDTVIGDDAMQVVYLEEGQMAIGVGGVGGLDTIAAACEGDEGRAKTKGRAQDTAHVLFAFGIIEANGGIACPLPGCRKRVLQGDGCLSWARDYPGLDTVIRHSRYQLENCHQPPSESSLSALYNCR